MSNSNHNKYQLHITGMPLALSFQSTSRFTECQYFFLPQKKWIVVCIYNICLYIYSFVDLQKVNQLGTLWNWTIMFLTAMSLIKCTDFLKKVKRSDKWMKNVLTSWEECRSKEIAFQRLLSIACMQLIISPFYRCWRITT